MFHRSSCSYCLYRNGSLCAKSAAAPQIKLQQCSLLVNSVTGLRNGLSLPELGHHSARPYTPFSRHINKLTTRCFRKNNYNKSCQPVRLGDTALSPRHIHSSPQCLEHQSFLTYCLSNILVENTRSYSEIILLYYSTLLLISSYYYY